MATIRAMTHDELRTLVNWAAGEGWNPGRTDADSFWTLDPEGYLGIEVDGQLAGGGAIVRYDERFGFMGLFIVRPEYRSRKLGTELWYARRDRLLARLLPPSAGGESTIGLDAVDAMIPFYERGGFRAFTRHRRFEVSAWCEGVEGDGAEAGPEPVELTSVPWELVTELDRQCFPADRGRFLHSWIGQPGARSLAVVEGKILRGYGVLRPCEAGWKVGPLFAQDRSVAETLLCRFHRIAAGEPVFLDLPDNNPEAVAMARDRGMREVFGCVRMYHGPAPQVRHERIFGVTTLEVG